MILPQEINNTPLRADNVYPRHTRDFDMLHVVKYSTGPRWLLWAYWERLNISHLLIKLNVMIQYKLATLFN